MSTTSVRAPARTQCCGRGLQPRDAPLDITTQTNIVSSCGSAQAGCAHTFAVIPSAREAPPGSLSLAAFHSPALASGDPLGDVYTPKLLLHLSWEQPGKNLVQPHLDRKNKYSGEKNEAASPQAALGPPQWSQRHAPSFPRPRLSGAADADEL